jgi:hypothetical protein
MKTAIVAVAGLALVAYIARLIYLNVQNKRGHDHKKCNHDHTNKGE